MARGAVEGGGADPTVRPGWEKGSDLEGLPQRLPIMGVRGRRIEGVVWGSGGVIR